MLHPKAMAIADRFWVTKEGAVIPYIQLDDEHLQNCIAMLAQTRRKHFPHYKHLIKELRRRIVVCI